MLPNSEHNLTLRHFMRVLFSCFFYLTTERAECSFSSRGKLGEASMSCGILLLCRSILV